jgi:hypothetical protein
MRVEDMRQLPSPFLQFVLIRFGIGGIDRSSRARRLVVDKISIIIIEARNLHYTQCRRACIRG